MLPVLGPSPSVMRRDALPTRHDLRHTLNNTGSGGHFYRAQWTRAPAF
jgi:hypothetical protein